MASRQATVSRETRPAAGIVRLDAPPISDTSPQPSRGGGRPSRRRRAFDAAGHRAVPAPVQMAFRTPQQGPSVIAGMGPIIARRGDSPRRIALGPADPSRGQGSPPHGHEIPPKKPPIRPPRRTSSVPAAPRSVDPGWRGGHPQLPPFGSPIPEGRARSTLGGAVGPSHLGPQLAAEQDPLRAATRRSCAHAVSRSPAAPPHAGPRSPTKQAHFGRPIDR